MPGHEVLEHSPSQKARRRQLFAVGLVFALFVAAIASWQYAARASGSTFPSLGWAESVCLSQVQNPGNASQMVPTGKSTITVVSFEHLGPLNGTKEGTTWIVLKDGAAESGFWCDLGDHGDVAESAPVPTQTRPAHPQQAAFMGSTSRIGYYGLVARVPSHVTRVAIVTARGAKFLRPVEGVVGCIVAVPMTNGSPLWSGVLTSFNSSGHIVGTGKFN